MITIKDEGFFDCAVSLIRDKRKERKRYVAGNYVTIDIEYGCLSGRMWILCTYESDDDGNVSISSIDDIDFEYIIDESGVEYTIDVEEIWKRL